MSQKYEALVMELNTIQDEVRAVFNSLDALRNNMRSAHTGYLVELEAAKRAAATAEASALPSLAERAVIELSGEYRLRSMYEMSSTLSASREDICAALGEAGHLYVLKRRIRDGAELIGLAERN
jgi:hypothetical protein